jgi:hypothetical protein
VFNGKIFTCAYWECDKCEKHKYLTGSAYSENFQQDMRNLEFFIDRKESSTEVNPKDRIFLSLWLKR